MACRRLTIEEYQQLLIQSPNPTGYTTLDLCEGPCAGPVSCSADWRSAITISVPGAIETGITTGGAGSVWFYWVVSKYPSGKTNVGGGIYINCSYPPTYKSPDNFFPESITYCASDTSNGFPWCYKRANFTVVLGPDGLPTRIKNITSQTKFCSDSSVLDCEPPDYPQITFGRP